MTDKEWYAKFTTIVLEGIELVNKDAGHWDIYQNQNALKEFLWSGKIPDQRKKEAIRSAKQCIANIMIWGGFAAAAIVLFFDFFLWIDIFLGDSGKLPGAIVFMIVSAAICGIGVLGKYYDALL